MKKKIFGLILMALFFSCNDITDVKNTKWLGVGENKNIELILNDVDGFIIKCYSETDRDSFCVSYVQKGDSVVITRKDDIVSIKESFFVISDTLKSGDMILIKE